MESDTDQANDPEARVAPEASAPSEKAEDSPAPSIRSRPIVYRGVVALTVGLGVGIGYYFGQQLGFALIGGLLGYVVGATVAPGKDKREAASSRFPNAHFCFFLSAGAWVPVAALGFWMLITGLIRGEGASLVLLFVLPTVTICWLIGGPMASQAGRNALEQIRTGARSEADLWFVRAGMAMSRGMTFALLAWLLWLLASIFI